GEGCVHFREEEELIFPLLAAYLDEPSTLLDRALAEHGELRAAAVRLTRAGGDVDPGDVAAAARLLERHIRCEEREIFPLLERTVPDDVLRAVSLPTRVDSTRVPTVVDLAEVAHWGIASDDLNATVINWPADRGVPEHRNDKADGVLLL